MRTASGERLAGEDLRQGLGRFFRIIVGRAGRELRWPATLAMPVLSDGHQVQSS
jgi:hypothetical protein